MYLPFRFLKAALMRLFLCGWASVFGLVCQTDAVPDADADSIIIDSLLDTATGSARSHTTLSHQHFSAVCAPLHCHSLLKSSHWKVDFTKLIVDMTKSHNVAVAVALPRAGGGGQAGAVAPSQPSQVYSEIHVNPTSSERNPPGERVVGRRLESSGLIRVSYYYLLIHCH